MCIPVKQLLRITYALTPMFTENEKSSPINTDFQHVNGNVFYDQYYDCVCLTLKGYSEGEVYRTLLNKAIELLKKYNTRKLMGDTRQNEVITLEDQDWTNNDWAQRAIEAGLKYNAIVLSEDIFGRLSVESMVDNAKTVIVKYFDKVVDAKEWLKSIP